MSRWSLVGLVSLLLLVPACGDDDTAPVAPDLELLGSKTFRGGSSGPAEFDEATFTMTLTDAPAIEVMSRVVHSGDEGVPGKRMLVVMNADSPIYDDVVARLTDGSPDQIQVGESNISGSQATSGSLQALFDLPGNDFSGRELAQIRFRVNEVRMEPRAGGGTEYTFSVLYEFLGR